MSAYDYFIEDIWFNHPCQYVLITMTSATLLNDPPIPCVKRRPEEAIKSHHCSLYGPLHTRIKADIKTSFSWRVSCPGVGGRGANDVVCLQLVNCSYLGCSKCGNNLVTFYTNKDKGQLHKAVCFIGCVTVTMDEIKFTSGTIPPYLLDV